MDDLGMMRDLVAWPIYDRHVGTEVEMPTDPLQDAVGHPLEIPLHEWVLQWMHDTLLPGWRGSVGTSGWVDQWGGTQTDWG